MGLRRLAIYDLDETLTRHATYTPFLAFAARRLHPWRLLLLPVWVVMMLLYVAGLYGRATLKQAGFRLLVGRADDARLAAIVDAFAAKVVAEMRPAARTQWDTDGSVGVQRVIATAALALYGQAIADRLAADHLIATAISPDGELPDGNCYGPVKYDRALAWFADQGGVRSDWHIMVWSDSMADAALLDWADNGMFVTTSTKRRAAAGARGWQVVDFR